MAAIYSVIAVVMTWPVARTLGTRLVPDLGDPAFICWVIAWDAGQILAAIGGNAGALASYWNANIFYPEPLTLAYSEHFTAQAIQALPIYVATGNVLIAYNLLFISTFALSGLALYVLVRDLTGRPLAAFLAGLAYAYAPYRMGQFSHLQVLSSYWMPFALVGVHRYFRRTTEGASIAARLRPLAGGAAALVMQNLSCGYFMVYFAPFAAAYPLYEMTQRRLLRDWRVWLHLAVAALVVAAATWPFVRPYVELRAVTGIGTRTVADIASFSADAHAFGTIASGTRLFGEHIRAFVKAEGEGFPGFAILACSAVGLLAGIRRSVGTLPWATMSDPYAVVTAVAGVSSLLFTGVLLWFFVAGHMAITMGGRTIVHHDATPALVAAAGACALFLVLGAWARRRDPRVSPTAFGFVAIGLAAAALLSLGPHIQAAGHGVATGPYSWLLTYVPGVSGLRAPARFLMIVAMFLAVLAGLGASLVLRTRRHRLGVVVVGAACLAIVAEAWVAPVPTNLPVVTEMGLHPPAPLQAGRRISPLYTVIRGLPASTVLIEFPFADPAYETMAVFYAGYHRKPIVNGYSGYFPRSYADHANVLREALDHPVEASEALRSSGATHALVHEGAFPDDGGARLTEWLESLGARVVTTNNRDTLFALP